MSLEESRSLQELIEERFETLSVKLPVFHPIALELERLKGDERASMEQVAAVLEKDPSLASQVLRLANSAFYRGLAKADTLSRAVTRLGLKRAASLAFAASQHLAYRSRTPPFGALLARLWLRSFAGACGARWLAPHIGQDERAEEAFLAALFHDLGELFLLRSLEELSERRRELTEAVIGEVVASMHPAIGYRLLLRWHLPEAYAIVARDHHLPEIEGSDWRLALIRLLDLACLKLGIGWPAEADLVLAAAPEAEALGLKEITLAQLEVLLEDVAVEAAEMLPPEARPDLAGFRRFS